MGRFELDIQELGPKADGIHRSSSGVVYVDRAVPGDRVEATVRTDAAGLYRGEITRVLEPSAHRQRPPCLHYDRCGNCTLLHVTSDYYRDWKIQLVKEAFAKQRLSPVRWLEPKFLPSGNRRRATFAAFRERGKVTLGYYKRRSKDIAPIDRCLVAHPKLFEMREVLRPYLANLLVDGGYSADVFIQLVGDAADVAITGPVGLDGIPDDRVAQIAEELVTLTPIARVSWRADETEAFEMLVERDDDALGVSFGKLRVRLPPAAFLQPTEAGERALVEAVMEALPEKGHFADFFSGSGTFTGPMLGRGSVDAFEASPDAVDALRHAKGNERLKAYRRDLFQNPLRKELGRYDAVVFDPPRGGCVELASALSQSTVPRLVGVSCNPATFARDARWLVGGGYVLESLQIVDQFFGSHHVEMVGVFSKPARPLQ